MTQEAIGMVGSLVATAQAWHRRHRRHGRAFLLLASLQWGCHTAAPGLAPPEAMPRQPPRESRSVPPSRAVDARRPGHALQDGVGYGAPTPQGAGIGQNRGPNAAGRGEALRLSNTRQVAVGWRGGPDHDAGGTGVRPSRPGRVVAR